MDEQPVSVMVDSNVPWRSSGKLHLAFPGLRRPKSLRHGGCGQSACISDHHLDAPRVCLGMVEITWETWCRSSWICAHSIASTVWGDHWGLPVHAVRKISFLFLSISGAVSQPHRMQGTGTHRIRLCFSVGLIYVPQQVLLRIKWSSPTHEFHP